MLATSYTERNVFIFLRQDMLSEETLIIIIIYIIAFTNLKTYKS